MPLVLYGCETLSLTLRDERRVRVFEKRMLRRIFGPKRDEVTAEWRKLHIEELNVLWCSPNIVRMIKSRRMRWADRAASTGERRRLYRVLVRKSEGRYHFEDLGVDERVILRRIIRKWDEGRWIGSSWLRIGTGGRHL